jgi:hypothetical protein
VTAAGVAAQLVLLVDEVVDALDDVVVVQLRTSN